jgi:histidyl-tRNA synthetase
VEDEELRGESLKLVQALRSSGRVVEYPLTPSKSDKQFKRALELKATWSLKLRQPQPGQIEAVLKNLKTREEKVVPPDTVVTSLV